MKRVLVPILIVLVVAAGVGGFFGGRMSGGSSTVATQATGTFGPGRDTSGSGGVSTGGERPTGDMAVGGGMTAGTIVDKDDSSITVQTEDGNTSIVFYSASTTISETSDASSDALVKGETVMITGSSNTDGTLTATRIQVGAAASALGGAAPGAPAGDTSTSTTVAG
jgi:hypothetical protein